jgi:predicted phosphate transport protein (TIGR00153 family)
MKSTNPLANLLGRSPFGPIQKHMRIVERCVLEVPPMFEALRADDMDGVMARKESIFAFEHEADTLKNEIRSHLPATLLMPVDRRDLLDLLGTQDSIAGAAQDVASLLALGRLRVPAAMDAQLMPFVQRVVDSVVTCTTAIDTLDELLETGFGRREGDKVLAIAQQIDGIETETDTMGMELVRKLIEHEKDTDVLSVVFWYRLLQSLGNIADEAENVGDRLRVLLAR